MTDSNKDVIYRNILSIDIKNVRVKSINNTITGYYWRLYLSPNGWIKCDNVKEAKFYISLIKSLIGG